MCLKDGLLFASGSRTNAGVDYVTSYSKGHGFSAALRYISLTLASDRLLDDAARLVLVSLTANSNTTVAPPV